MYEGKYDDMKFTKHAMTGSSLQPIMLSRFVRLFHELSCTLPFRTPGSWPGLPQFHIETSY